MVDTLLPGAILLVYALVNGASFIAYYRDKKLAERNTWRTPERWLLILALFGPLGAFAAMRLFRHKTQKAKFRLVPLFLCLHLVLFAAFALGFA